MAEHKTPDVDAKQVEAAQAVWHSFVTGGKYAISFVVIVLVGLALAFVKF